MTYITVLDSFKATLENLYYDLSCLEKSWSTTSSDGTESSTPNPAYELIESWAEEMTITKEQIFAALDCLFNDPDDDYEVEDINFQLINGYADGSKTFEKYDIKTEEFSEDASYFYVRGNLYDMLPKANEGVYVNLYFDNIRLIETICNEYEKMYDDYPKPPVSGGDNGESTISKLEYFWSREYDDFEEKINAAIGNFKTIKTQFSELIPFIRNYKNLFYNVSQELGKIDNFISSLNKTVNAPKTRLSDSYSKVNTSGFGMYSSSLGSLYTMFTEALEIRDASKYYATDEFNMYLRKIFSFKIYQKYKFFETAKAYLNWIENFRKKFNI